MAKRAPVGSHLSLKKPRGLARCWAASGARVRAASRFGKGLHTHTRRADGYG
eukprot:CAMPEP_0114625364 /NCGR_PEP_ID=MMETSP0168-20121206/11233_1 /TAXON_ID=95228 ORGANISM="Vannella sp., Strain DIVA3 517/6/12" /NCGR_SAMPLE_ID=MMETSP0168 /ASSEMBLY_ACC=CAM_ASM_000044 /LENGTH=51 /DNA_ID=CAMNT_0001836645 /DNA_START=154 /DNA_END=305 /DNA_ORIENTATION=-